MAAPLNLRKALTWQAPPPAGRRRFCGIRNDITLGRPKTAETSPEMWTRRQEFEQHSSILPLARFASYVTISSPKTIRELSHVD
jgi:hypothetical protein